MKYLLAAFAAFFSSVAFAEVMVMPLSPEVVIVIGDKKCGENGLMASAIRQDKMYVPGCATFVKYGEPFVRIQWQKGDFTEFPTRFFHMEK